MEVSRFLRKEVKEADTDNNGLIDLQEFQSYFQKLARMQQSEARSQRLQTARHSLPTGILHQSPLYTQIASSMLETPCLAPKQHLILVLPRYTSIS